VVVLVALALVALALVALALVALALDVEVTSVARLTVRIESPFAASPTLLGVLETFLSSSVSLPYQQCPSPAPALEELQVAPRHSAVLAVG